MTKTLKRQVISLLEFEKTPEARNRMFTVIYKEICSIIRVQKTFQHKKYVYDLVDNPNVHCLKIIREDVINE